MPPNLPAVSYQQTQQPHSLPKLDAPQYSQPAMGVPPPGMVAMQGGTLPGGALLQWPPQGAGGTVQSNGVQGMGFGTPMGGLSGVKGVAEGGMQLNGQLQP